MPYQIQIHDPNGSGKWEIDRETQNPDATDFDAIGYAAALHERDKAKSFRILRMTPKIKLIAFIGDIDAGYPS